MTIPTMRADGTLLQKSGYDGKSQLLLQLPSDVSLVPENPTLQQVRDAVDTLMFPVREFPCAGSIDRSVLLAVLLAAVVRPVLATAPAFAFDAPKQGAGKTLLARVAGALLLGTEPSVLPPASGEETRKQIFSILRVGGRVIIWDNVTEKLSDASLAAALKIGRAHV